MSMVQRKHVQLDVFSDKSQSLRATGEPDFDLYNQILST